MTDINLSPAAGTCSLCGTGIASATAARCVVCEAKCTRCCPECSPAGKLLWKYQHHKGCDIHSSQDCQRCGVYHTEPQQLECPVCHNDRFVLQLPEGAGK